MSQPLIDDPVGRQRLGFQRTVGEDREEVLRVELWVDPGGGVPAHIHPALEERFEVLAGEPSFLAGRRWQTAAPGDTVVVPPGVRHAYRNRGEGTAHVVCEARPPSSLQPFLEEVAALGRAGELTSRALPKTPRAVLQAAAIAHRHRDMVVLLFPPMLPPRLQRMIFPGLARLAERRGHGAGRATDSR